MTKYNPFDCPYEENINRIFFRTSVVQSRLMEIKNDDVVGLSVLCAFSGDNYPADLVALRDDIKFIISEWTVIFDEITSILTTK